MSDCAAAGRLSKAEIERMVKNAEMYKEEDDKQRLRISMKNSLESYVYNMKATAEDTKLRDKISDDDRQMILDNCNELVRWIDGNQVRCAHYLHLHNESLPF